MTTTTSKSQLKSVSRQLSMKAQSWGQVAKQLSGMKGKVALSKKESITIHEAFIRLGVHTKSNQYSAQDLGLAWSERLKEGEAQHTATFGCDNSWRCPLLSKAVSFNIEVCGGSYKLHEFADGDYKPVKVQELCRVVKAEDKQKGSNDVIVTAQVVLRGLVQSIFVEDTLKELAESKAKAQSLTEGFIDLGDGDEHAWVAVNKTAKGAWVLNGTETAEEQPKAKAKTAKAQPKAESKTKKASVKVVVKAARKSA